MEKFTICYGVESIGEAAFKNNAFLKEIVIPSSVTSLGSQSFSYMDNLKTVSVDEELRSKDYDAFAGYGTELKYVPLKPMQRRPRRELTRSR